MVAILYNFCAFVCKDCAHNTDQEYKHIGMHTDVFAAMPFRLTGFVRKSDTWTWKSELPVFELCFFFALW